MEDIAEQVNSAQHFSIEFEDNGTDRLMFLRYWRETKLCRVFICRSALPAADLTGELGSLSRLLSVVSTDPDIVACSGCSVDYIRAIDQHPSYSRGIQSCFRFETLDLRLLMHKYTYSVFGRIDMFSVLQCLLVSLGRSVTEDWVLESPELTRVSIFCSTQIVASYEVGRACTILYVLQLHCI